MIWFLLIIFSCLVVVVAFEIVPKSYNKKTRMHLLDIIVCTMGGGAFVIMMLLFMSVEYTNYAMDVGWFFRSSHWKLLHSNFESSQQYLAEFVFGYIFTYLCIWLKRQYNKLK